MAARCAEAGGSPAACTGSDRLRLASPGMQTSRHISHCAWACSVTEPASCAGTLRLTGSRTSSS